MTQSQADTRYAKNGNVHVAYQVFGTGSVDLVFVPGFVSQIEFGKRNTYELKGVPELWDLFQRQQLASSITAVPKLLPGRGSST